MKALNECNRLSFLPVEHLCSILVAFNWLRYMATSVIDLEWPWRSFPVCRFFQVQSSAFRRTFVQYLTRFQVTARSRGPSAITGLLAYFKAPYHICSILLDFNWQYHWRCTTMEEGLSQENCLLALRCGFCQIILNSCLKYYTVRPGD